MSDPSTDDKIAQLVHSVLEAVDLRLADIRHELQISDQESDRRFLEMQQELRDLSVRIDRLDSAQRRGVAAHDLAEQQLTEMRTGLARLQQRLGSAQPTMHSPAPPTPVTPAPVTGLIPALAPSPPSFEKVAAPLVAPHLATPPPITTEIPRIDVSADITAELPTVELATIKLASYEPVTTPVPAIEPSAIEPATQPVTQPATDAASAPVSAAPADESGQIDLDQLAKLLNERLGHLDLPRSD